MIWIFYVPFLITSVLILMSGRRNGFVVAQLFVVTSIFALLAGTRYGDNDYSNYADIFKAIPYLDGFDLASVEEIHGEIGYLFTASIAKTFGFNHQGFLFLIAATTVAFIALATWRLSYFPLASMLFYYSHVFLLREMMQIRAALAIAIMLLAFSLHGNFKRIAGILGASLFHSGALIVLPFYLLVQKLDFNWKSYLPVFLFALSVSTVGVAQPLTALLAEIGLLPAAVATYVGWDIYNARLNVLTNPVTWKAFFILYCLRKVTNEELGSAIGLLRNLYASGLLVFLCFADFAILAGRLSTFLFLGEAILLSWALFYQRNRNIGILICILASLAQLSLNLLLNNVHQQYDLYFLAI